MLQSVANRKHTPSSRAEASKHCLCWVRRPMEHRSPLLRPRPGPTDLVQLRAPAVRAQHWRNLVRMGEAMVGRPVGSGAAGAGCGSLPLIPAACGDCGVPGCGQRSDALDDHPSRALAQDCSPDAPKSSRVVPCCREAVGSEVWARRACGAPAMARALQRVWCHSTAALVSPLRRGGSPMLPARRHAFSGRDCVASGKATQASHLPPGRPRGRCEHEPCPDAQDRAPALKDVMALAPPDFVSRPRCTDGDPPIHGSVKLEPTFPALLQGIPCQKITRAHRKQKPRAAGIPPEFPS